jgi:hypothetical protein
MSISSPKGPLRGLGNYSTQVPRVERVERRLAMVVRYLGERAHIRFHDGTTYGMPSSPLIQIGVPEGGTFIIVTHWQGKTPVKSSVELPHDRRPTASRRSGTPKIIARDGRKMITRQPERKPNTTPRGPG